MSALAPKRTLASVLFGAILSRSFLNFLSDQVDDASGSFVSVGELQQTWEDELMKMGKFSVSNEKDSNVTKPDILTKFQT